MHVTPTLTAGPMSMGIGENETLFPDSRGAGLPAFFKDGDSGLIATGTLTVSTMVGVLMQGRLGVESEDLPPPCRRLTEFKVSARNMEHISRSPSEVQLVGPVQR